LSTVLNFFPRCVIAWQRCTKVRADEMTETLDLASKASGRGSAEALLNPKLLIDHGRSENTGAMAEYIDAEKMSHKRGAPLH
jgi:hypothetical protein